MPALVGLGYVARGGQVVSGRTPAGGLRLFGWSAEGHWMLAPAARR